MAIEIKVNLSGDEQIDNLAKSVGKTSDSVKSLKQQFIDARKELMAMDETDPGFIQKAAEAGKLKDQIADMNAVIKATAGSTTENLGNAFGGVASIGIGAFQGIAAAQALFGSESEDLQKVLVRLQAAANMADAIRSFGQFGDTMTQVKASLGAVTAAMFGTATATQVEVAATEEATVAQAGLNATMLANPIFLVIAAIGALVAAYYAFSKASDDAAISEAALKKEREAQAAALKKEKEANKENSNQIAQSQVEYVKLIGTLSKTNEGSKERKDLIKQINEQYGTTLKNLSDEKKFQEQLNDSVGNYLEYKRQEFAMKMYASKLEQSLSVQQQQRIAVEKELTDKGIKWNDDYVTAILEGEVKINAIRGASTIDKRTNTRVQQYADSDVLKSAGEKYRQMNQWQDTLGTKIQNTATKMDTLGFSTASTTNNTSNASDTNRELAQTLDELNKKNQEYGKTEKELLDLSKARKDAEIQAQYLKSTDADKDKQRTAALLANQQSYDNAYNDLRKKQASEVTYMKVVSANEAVQLMVDENTKKLQADKDYYDKKEKLSKEDAEKQKALDQSVQDAKFQMAQDTLSLIMNITELFGSKNEKAARRAFAIEKAAKLTSATLSGIEGTINAFKTASDSPLNAIIPGYNFIQAGLAGAFAATNIAKIASTQFGGSSQKPDTTPSGGSGNVSSTPSYNLYGNNNDKNSTSANMQQQVNVNNQVTVKAVVSETEISDTQKRVAKYRNAAEL